jgi:hypothetical protein
LASNPDTHITLEEAALWQLSAEMPLTDAFVRKPCCVFLSSLVALLILTGIVAYFEMYKIHAFNVRDYLVWEDPKTWDFDKMNLVKRELLQGSNDGVMALQS